MNRFEGFSRAGGEPGIRAGDPSGSIAARHAQHPIAPAAGPAQAQVLAADLGSQPDAEGRVPDSPVLRCLREQRPIQLEGWQDHQHLRELEDVTVRRLEHNEQFSAFIDENLLWIADVQRALRESGADAANADDPRRRAVAGGCRDRPSPPRSQRERHRHHADLRRGRDFTETDTDFGLGK